MTSANKNIFLTAIFLCAVFLFTFFAINNTDLGFILKTGQYIWEHHEIPHNDIFSFSAPGVDWIAHYWLTGVLFYGIFLLGGYLGLKISVALVAALTFFFVIKRFGLYSKDYPLFLILFYPLTFFSFEFWNVRGENFSNLFLAILLYLIDQWRFKKSKWALYLIPLLSMLWANMHGGVLLGLAILGFWAAVSLYEAHFALSKIKIQASVFVAACLASLLNPFGYKSPLLLFLLNSKGISEFDSLFAFVFGHAPNLLRYIAFGIMVFAAGFLIWRQYSLWKRGRSFGKLFDIGLVSVAFLMPLMSIRYMVFLPLIALPFVIGELSSFLTERFPNQDRENLFKAAVGVGLILIVLRLPFVLSEPDVNTAAIPVAATDFIKNANVPEPLFNNLENGGWLIWKLWPERKVFIDGRSDIYKYGVYDDYLDIRSMSNGWVNLVNEKYKFNSFLLSYRLSKETEIPVSNLMNKLNDLGFRLIYWDDNYIILVRDTPENQPIIKKYAYYFIKPFQNSASLPPDKLPLALEEVRRALSISPDSKILQNLEKSILNIINLQ